MLGRLFGKVLWVGRTAATVFGLALVMALVFGVATTAIGATGGNFLLGKKNVADAISSLVKQGPGPALSLVVEANQPPLKVNSAAGKATNLNADKLDGIDSSEIGVNGRSRVSVNSAFNSDSGKNVRATCPSGKVLVGTGFAINGGISGDEPNTQTDVVINSVLALDTEVIVLAYEESPTANDWRVQATALCAKAGTP